MNPEPEFWLLQSSTLFSIRAVRAELDWACRSKPNDRKAWEGFGSVQLRLAIQGAHVAIRADEAGWIKDPTVDQHLELGELA